VPAVAGDEALEVESPPLALRGIFLLMLFIRPIL